jgi:outer membrane protein OmpA-like peptidoglycan-associated protein
MKKTNLIITSTLALTLTACVSMDDPNRRAKTGAGAGAVVGAVIGQVVGDDTKGTLIGAAVGAVAGGAVGHYMDKQQAEFERELEAEQRQHDIEIERMKDDTLKLSVNSEVSFDFGKATVKPAFYLTLDKLAEVLHKYDRTVVHVVGHTDSIGSNAYNQGLSERRAQAVGSYLSGHGVPYNKLRTEGRGELEPRDTNETEAGRQLNRRVEIFVKPIVEGQEQRAYESPQYY